MDCFHKWLSGFLAALFLTASWPWILRGQEAAHTIGGRVLDSRREAVGGMKIIAKDDSKKSAFEATSNGEGFYCLEKLAAGRYHLTLEPMGSAFQGNTVVAFLGAQDLTVDWFVSANVKALGAASVGQSVCTPLTQTQRRVVGGILATGWLGSLVTALAKPRSTSPSN